MTFKKGQSGNVSGRPTGATDKKKKEIREAYQELIECSLPNLQTWLTDIAERDPIKAFELVLKLSEYCIPKQRATEIKESGYQTFVVTPPVFPDDETIRRINRVLENEC
jgi:hypothetical protein